MYIAKLEFVVDMYIVKYVNDTYVVKLEFCSKYRIEIIELLNRNID